MARYLLIYKFISNLIIFLFFIFLIYFGFLFIKK